MTMTKKAARAVRTATMTAAREASASGEHALARSLFATVGISYVTAAETAAAQVYS